MGLFDMLKNSLEGKAKSLIKDVVDGKSSTSPQEDNPDGLKYASHVSITIDKMPSTLEEFKAMDGTDFKDPNKMIALTVVALCAYPKDKDMCIEMLNFIKGPRPLSNQEIQFLADRFKGKAYLADSYFEGANPKNGYKPSEPLTIKVYKTSHSEDLLSEGYLQLFVKSGGADSGRIVKLRKKESTGEWFLWEYFLLPDIRKPDSENPWA